MAVSRADLGDVSWIFREIPEDPGVISEKPVDAAEVAAGEDGAGIVVGEVVEKFRGEFSHELTLAGEEVFAMVTGMIEKGGMKISSYTGGMVQTNGYLVETADGNLLVDAPLGIANWVAEKGVRIDSLILTHQHYDHVEDAAAIRASGVKVLGWADYSKELTLESFGSSWGLPEVVPFEVDGRLEAGETEILGAKVVVSHVPGHSQDSISLYFPGEGTVFAGDALFAGSVGRCDLPGGDFDLLISGIRAKLLTLPDETRVLSGHGPETTVGRELVGNGFLR